MKKLTAQKANGLRTSIINNAGKAESAYDAIHESLLTLIDSVQAGASLDQVGAVVAALDPTTTTCNKIKAFCISRVFSNVRADDAKGLILKAGEDAPDVRMGFDRKLRFDRAVIAKADTAKLVTTTELKRLARHAAQGFETKDGVKLKGAQLKAARAAVKELLSLTGMVETA